MTRPSLRLAAKWIGIALLAATVAWGLLAIGGLRVRPGYCYGVAMAAAVVAVAIRLATGPYEPVYRPAAATNSGPQPYADLYFLEYRLSWGSVERPRFEQRVRPLLVRVADERLRQRHGVDFRADPERARAIVGDELWLLMTREPITEGPPPTHREVTALVQAMERI